MITTVYPLELNVTSSVLLKIQYRSVKNSISTKSSRFLVHESNQFDACSLGQALMVEDDEDRTDDPLLAKQVLSQAEVRFYSELWWGLGLNQRPRLIKTVL